MKYFDRKNKRLIFINQQASTSFWDEQWENNDLKKDVEKNGRIDNFVRPITEKYIKPDKKNKILEGGCGKGHFVYSLNNAGYDAYGIDFAPKIIEKLNILFPEMKISLGDVRKTLFTDDFFDGYWSLGVIEHFFSGFDDTAKEMKRILKSGGYLFITFPQMSLLRKVKAFFGGYEEYKENFDLADFYQFALNKEDVCKNFVNNGFELVSKKSIDGVNGLRNEINFCTGFFDKLYRSKNIFFKIIRKLTNILFSWFSGHVALLIFRKK